MGSRRLLGRRVRSRTAHRGSSGLSSGSESVVLLRWHHHFSIPEGGRERPVPHETEVLSKKCSIGRYTQTIGDGHPLQRGKMFNNRSLNTSGHYCYISTRRSSEHQSGG